MGGFSKKPCPMNKKKMIEEDTQHPFWTTTSSRTDVLMHLHTYTCAHAPTCSGGNYKEVNSKDCWLDLHTEWHCSSLQEKVNTVSHQAPVCPLVAILSLTCNSCPFSVPSLLDWPFHRPSVRTILKTDFLPWALQQQRMDQAPSRSQYDIAHRSEISHPSKLSVKLEVV